MRIVHILPRIITKSSGPAHSVTALCQSVYNAGADVRLAVLGPTIIEKQDYAVDTFSTPKIPFAFRIGYSPKMKTGLKDLAKTANIFHNHSLWMFPNVYPVYAVQGSVCKLVTSPRGTLSDWALSRSKIKKRVMRVLGQDALFKKTGLFHATSESEYTEIRSFIKRRVPVAVIPNGVEIPLLEKKISFSGKIRKLIFLSRIHETKGIDSLVTAWEIIQEKMPDWELVVAGPLDTEFAQSILKSVAQRKIKRISFVGEVTGEEKEKLFDDADLFVLPTRSENFGIAVAEALAHGVPVITTKGAPWKGLLEKECGWWIDIGTRPLVECLTSAMGKSPQTLWRMGQNGQKWMQRDFGWDRIGQMMYQTYQWLLGEGDRPSWVALD